MKWNKKAASLIAVLSLLIGGAGAIGFQVHAQQKTLSTILVQAQVQSASVGGQENSAIDKDNIQNGKDSGQPELVAGKESSQEAKDGVEADGNLPGGGHQDQNGANADHQFDGVE